MMRKMKQQEEKEKSPASNSTVEKLELQLFFDKDCSFEFPSQKATACSPVYLSEFISHNYCNSIFHPPTT